MYLKQLELKGFKSFAEATEIQFHPGLNIIVGPNGCGKSNIVDAIRWVLGESNVRNLRGQRGEDVIFTGTDRKKPLGFASVSMVIDNQDKALDTDFTEVCVSRRVYRSGESEFSINKREVRLKDIHNLFAGTGLGRKGYSIIGQGELEQILNARPFERRLILEEAAGLVIYRQKKDEAESKLEQTASDMVRIKDIINELADRMNDLREKAARAKRYLAVSNELGDVERKVLAYDIFQHEEELKAREQEYVQLKDEITGVRREIDKLEAGMRAVQEEMDSLQRENAELKERRYQLGSAVGQQESERRLAEERITHARERISQLEGDISRTQDMLAKLDEDLSLSRKNLQDKEIERQTREKEVLKVEQEIRDVASKMAEREQELEALKGELIDLLNRESGIKNQIQEREEKVKRYQEKIDRSDNEVQYRREKLAILAETAETLARDRELEDRALQELHARQHNSLDKRQEILDELKGNEERLVELEKQARQLQNRILTLEEAVSSHAGFPEAVRRLLKEKQNKKLAGLIGVVADLISVPHGLEIAIEAAAGRGLENIVVRTDRDAREAIELLKSRMWGRATFLPLNILRPNRASDQQIQEICSIPGVIGAGAGLVQCDQEYRKAVEHLLGRVIAVEDLDTGLQVFKKYPNFKIVTREGDIINASGAMTGGKVPERGPSPLQHRNELSKARQEMDIIRQEMEARQQKVEQIQQALRGIEEDLSSLAREIGERSFHRDILDKEIVRNREEMKQVSQEIEQVLAESRIARREMESLRSELVNQQQEAEQVRQEAGQASARVEQVRTDLDQVSRRRELLQERYANLAELLKASEKELDSMRRSVRQIEEVRDSYLKNLTDFTAEMKRLHATIEIENSRCQELLRSRVELEREMDRVDGLIRVLDRKLASAQTLAAEYREKMLPLTEQLGVLEERLRSLELRKVRTETEHKNALLNWEERFAGEPFQVHWEAMDARVQRDLKRRMEALKESLEDIGPVDLGSINELEEVEKRHSFLNSQLQDLVEAKKDLNRLIEEAETQMNQRFKEFLNQANQSFRETFINIFRGGEAELILEAADDTWQSGVEILVKMPGKRRQPLNLLSGGERALTCIAFIFSLLILKPVPFCLLDEIDASLDEVNLMRFTEYLRRLSRDIQFIVITHRQGTIEAGDTIYGVTMAEQGVSEVLSITLKEAESLAG